MPSGIRVDGALPYRVRVLCPQAWGLYGWGMGSGDVLGPRDLPAKRRDLVVLGGLRAHTCVTVSPLPWGGGMVAGPEVEPNSLPRPPSKAAGVVPATHSRVLHRSGLHGEETKRSVAAMMQSRIGHRGQTRSIHISM